MKVEHFRVTPEGYFTSRWGLPEYMDWIDESMSWKQTCSIGDWSFLWERRFKGPDALRLLSDTSINSLAKFDILQAKHIVHCNDNGKIIAEGIATRLADDEFVLFGRGTFWVDYVRRKGGYDATSTAVDSFNFQVAGPNALAVAETAAGGAFYRSPVELGWGKSIRCDHEFKGRAALEAELAAPRRQIRTLVWDADDVVEVYASLFRKDHPPYHFMEMPRDQRGFMYADKVLCGGREVGVATSRGYSYYFREMLSLAVIDVDVAELGKELTVVWGEPGERQIEIRAKVAPAPYKQDNRRIDLHALR